jgi:hypothetical protein
MKLKPTQKNFKAWTKCVPMTGDLVFLKQRYNGLFSNKIRISASSKLQKSNIWSLNSRSWYDYALGRADYHAWLPPGEIEKLPANILKEVGMMQAAIKVPTLIKASKLPEKILKKLLRIKTYAWVTARSWKKLSQTERVSVMAAWFSQNNVARSETIPFSRMPTEIRRRMRDNKLEKLLNSFRNESGGNCFAAAAAFVMKDMTFLKKWVFWIELKSLLKKGGFKTIRQGETPCYGDILVFSLNEKTIHAAIYLGAGIYFEKAGQDFYEGGFN